MRMHHPFRPARTLAAALVVGLALSGCGSSTSGSSGSTSAATGSAADTAGSAGKESDALTISDPWVKVADSGMTAVFGTLENSGDRDVVVTEAASDISPMMELHETVPGDDGAMAMRPKKGGFTVPAGGSHELTPGGDHIMVMDLQRPLRSGEDITFTITTEDGSSASFDATAKEFSGADEKYVGGEGSGS